MTLESQYKQYQIKNPESLLSFEEWMEKVHKPFIKNAIEQTKDKNEKH